MTLGGAWKRGKGLVLQEWQRATSLCPGHSRDLQKTGPQDWVASGHPAVPGVRLCWESWGHLGGLSGYLPVGMVILHSCHGYCPQHGCTPADWLSHGGPNKTEPPASHRAVNNETLLFPAWLLGPELDCCWVVLPVHLRWVHRPSWKPSPASREGASLGPKGAAGARSTQGGQVCIWKLSPLTALTQGLPPTPPPRPHKY